MLVFLLLHKVLRKAAQEGTTNCAEETVALFAAKVVASETATNCAQETSILLGHCRSIGIVVGGVGV